MTIEDRLKSLRLEADAGPLKASVLKAAAGARREQKVWRWTSVAAAAVLAIAIPVNLAVDNGGAAIAVKPVVEKIVPADVREALRTRSALASTKPVRPRTVEDIR